MNRRTIAYSLGHMHQINHPQSSNGFIGIDELLSLRDFYDAEIVDHVEEIRQPVASQLEDISLRSTALATPSKDQVESMLHKLCGGRCHDGSWKVSDTSPLALLRDENWDVFLGIIICITLVIAGLGSEVLVYVLVLLRSGWTPAHDRLWILSQICIFVDVDYKLWFGMA